MREELGTKRFFKRIAIYLLLYSSSGVASDFGTTGLISTPTARMQNDGEFSLVLTKSKPANIFNITFQATPWLEGTFRYTIFNPDRVPDSRDELRDRSYEIKLRLLREGIYKPQLAVGARDVLGTGAWEGEYIVANKRFDNFDFSLGMGWGRFADRGGFDNPLKILTDKFSVRPEFNPSSIAGEPRYNFFRGEAALFGGVSYTFRNYPLVLQMQYNSDSYEREKRFGTLTKAKPISYGLEWHATQSSTLAINYQQSEYLGLRLSYHFNAKSNPNKKPVPAFYSIADDRNNDASKYKVNPKSWYDSLLYDYERSGLRLIKGKFEPGYPAAHLEIENTNYALTADAVNRALLLAEVHLPSQVARINLYLRENGLDAPTVSYLRTTVGSSAKGSTNNRILSEHEFPSNIEITAPRSFDRATNNTDFLYPKIALGADLAARVQLFDPDEPLRHQVYLKLSGRVLLSEHWNIYSEYWQDITNDFSTARVSDSVLPHVRSDSNLYLQEGESGLNSLYLDNKASLSKSLHYRFYLGILEEMYAGLGIESLYHVFDNRWAVGLSLSYLKQREYEKLFRFRDYESLVGHLSFYWASPFYNIDAALHIGQYLARDKGYTLEARRTFDNGFEIGAFFTRTNVSAADFGEGQFDKGLFFRIPFNNFTRFNTKSAFATIMRPLNRDGGRKLEDFGQTLWFDRRGHRLDRLRNSIPRMRP